MYEGRVAVSLIRGGGQLGTAPSPVTSDLSIYTLAKIASYLPSRGLTKMTYFFGAPKARTKTFAISRNFRLNLRVIDASDEGASENFRVFSMETAYDVIIFKFQGGGGGNCPRLPPSGRLWT